MRVSSSTGQTHLFHQREQQSKDAAPDSASLPVDDKGSSRAASAPTDLEGSAEKPQHGEARQQAERAFRALQIRLSRLLCAMQTAEAACRRAENARSAKLAKAAERELYSCIDNVANTVFSYSEAEGEFKSKLKGVSGESGALLRLRAEPVLQRGAALRPAAGLTDRASKAYWNKKLCEVRHRCQILPSPREQISGDKVNRLFRVFGIYLHLPYHSTFAKRDAVAAFRLADSFLSSPSTTPKTLLEIAADVNSKTDSKRELSENMLTMVARSGLREELLQKKGDLEAVEHELTELVVQAFRCIPEGATALAHPY